MALRCVPFQSIPFHSISISISISILFHLISIFSFHAIPFPFPFHSLRSSEGCGQARRGQKFEVCSLIASLRSARHIARWLNRMNVLVWYIVSPKQKELEKCKWDQWEAMKWKVRSQVNSCKIGKKERCSWRKFPRWGAPGGPRVRKAETFVGSTRSPGGSPGRSPGGAPQAPAQQSVQAPNSKDRPPKRNFPSGAQAQEVPECEQLTRSANVTDFQGGPGVSPGGPRGESIGYTTCISTGVPVEAIDYTISTGLPGEGIDESTSSPATAP